MTTKNRKRWRVEVPPNLVPALFAQIATHCSGRVISPRIEHEDSCPRINPNGGECSCQTVDVCFWEDEVSESLAPSLGLSFVQRRKDVMQ
jgi:hypothetical protein